MILALADATDARGLRLGGATAVRCRSREDVVRALRSATEGAAPAMVMISPPVYALAPQEIDAFRDRRGAPLVLVLPEARIA